MRALRLEETIPHNLQDRAPQHIAECPKCQRVLQEAEELRRRLKPALNSAHPSSENLLAFLTADNPAPETAGGELPQGSADIRAHLRSCSFCRSRVKHLQEEIAQIRSIMKNVKAELTFESDYQVPRNRSVFAHSPQKKRFILPPLSKAVVPTAIACAALLVLFFVNFTMQSDTYPIAHLNTDNFNVFPVARGGANEEIGLLMAEEATTRGEFLEARNQLARLDFSQLSAEQSLRFRLCDLMLSLKDAQRSYFSFFPHFEKSQVRTALQPMEEALAVRETPLSGTEAYWGLAHYYCAKAYLMLEEKERALTHLQKARLTQHQRSLEAERILQILQAK